MESTIQSSCLTCDFRPDRLFCDMPAESLKAFDEIKSRATYPRGTVLFAEGRPVRGIYILCDGRAKLSICAENGKRLTLRIAGPGEVLGLGAALSNLHREGSLAWIWVTREQMEHVGAKEEDCEGLVNYALSIHDVEVAVFFRELPEGRLRASLRSKGQVNVSEVAEYFGGGGHKCASGCSLDGPLSIAVARVIEQLRRSASIQ